MDTETQSEKKLKELQTYVPFLEDLIKKLEALPSNSREAQLTKMKQLHGLLTGSANKLKPETLEKCESVLIRLQGKLTNVTLPKSDLEISLAKLKSVNKIEKPPPPPPPPSSSSTTKWKHERIQYPQKDNNEPVIKPKESSSVDYKDHDYRPREELQGNLFQRRNYRALNDPISLKNEKSKSSSKSIVEDVLKKPPLSADDISNLLHETTDDDEENLDAKDLAELYKLQNSIVDKMKNETDHGLVDNDYTGHNRLAFKYPRKKIDPLLSPVSSNGSAESQEHNIKLPIETKQSSSIYANITTLSPIPPYNLDNNFMKPDWFSKQAQMNTPPIRNVPSVYGKDTNVSMQPQSNIPSVYVNDPRLRQKLQQQQQPQSQLPIQPLLNNSNNYYPWYQTNGGQQNQMAAFDRYIQQQQQSQFQPHQFHQQFQMQPQQAWGGSSSSTIFTDQNQHQHYNISYNNHLNNGGHLNNFDDPYKKFHPKLNDMVERKFYEKSKKSQHDNIPINLHESTKFEISKPKATEVHAFISLDDDWDDEVPINTTPKANESLSTRKESTSSGKNSVPINQNESTNFEISNAKATKVHAFISLEDDWDDEVQTNTAPKANELLSTRKESTSSGKNSVPINQNESTNFEISKPKATKVHAFISLEDDWDDEVQTNTAPKANESLSTRKESVSSGKNSLTTEKELTVKEKESTWVRKEATSKANESMVKGKETTAMVKESTSKGKESISKGKKSISKYKEPTSKGKDSLSKGKESISKEKETKSKVKEWTSKGKESTPKGKESTSTSKDSTIKEKELTPNKKDSTTKQKEQPSKENVLDETEVRKISTNKEKTVKSDKNGEISITKNQKVEDSEGTVEEKVSPPEAIKCSHEEKQEPAVAIIPENKSNDEEKITKEWIEKTLINLFKPNKSTEDSSSNILGLLSKVLDENKFNQIKNILQDDDTPSSRVEEVTAQTENKINEPDNSEKDISSVKSISTTSSVAGGDDDEKEFSEKDDISDTAEKPRKLRPQRRNELDKLNLDIRNMFICEGVLTSTGRRMCTILKDNAYTDTNEKERKSSAHHNNTSRKVDVENLRTTRKNPIKNLRVVVPKIKLTKEQKMIHRSDDYKDNDNDNIKEKEVNKKTKNATARSKTLALRQKRRRSNRGKQWASGIIRQSRRKQTKDAADNANKQTNDDDDVGVKTRNRLATVKIDEGEIETEVEDNIPDDQSSISDFSECSAIVPAVTVTKPIIKNIDKNYYFGNKKSNRCVLCSKACSMRLMPKHYVSKHNSYEVFISRLNPEVANVFINNLEERSGTRTFHKLRPVIKFSCYFCDSLCFLSVDDWISHIASHTGEYLRKCTKCPWQTAFSYLHQCTKKGVTVVIKEFNFEGNNFCGYLCTECNYVQLQKENVKKHVEHEHNSSEKEIKILKINLINVPPVKIIKRGRKKLAPIEEAKSPSPVPIKTVEAPFPPPVKTVEASPSTPIEMVIIPRPPTIETVKPQALPETLPPPVENAKVSRSTNKTVSIPETPSELVSRSDGDSDKNFHAKEKEIIGEMEMRKNSSSSIVDRLKARFKEPVAAQPSTNERIVYNAVEKETHVVPNVNENLNQVVNTTTQDKPVNNTGDDEADNKSNDSDWEDFDDGHSCDSNTSISKLQAEIETNSTKPSTLTNTLVRLLDKIKSVPEKRKSTPSPDIDECKTKKQRIDFRDILKQTTDTETPENGTSEISEAADNSKLIEIKKEISESIQNNDQYENAVVFRIERTGYKIKQNSFPQAYTYLCLFDNCKFSTTNSIEFTNHMNAKTNEFWEGFCYICESYVRADENMPLSLELKHMLEVHLKMNISINVDELVSKPPSLSLKKLPGDLLSSSILPCMPIAPTENMSEMLLIKPWTTYQNQKTHTNCEEMLKEMNLSNLYKCMGINCSYSTSGVINYLDHLKNHEKYAEDQLIVNPCNLDTSSWLECPYCEIFADTYYDLVQHVTEKHKNSFYQCGYCFYRSFLATNVVMHRNKHHNDLPLSVFLCDKMENLPKINFEKILSSRANNIRPLHCNLESCKNKEFYALDHFINHHAKHNQNQYVCEFCSISVDAQTILAHLVTHGIGLFECIYCRFGTNRIKKIQIHMSDKHPTKLLFSTLRIGRPENNKLPQHDIANNIGSVYLVNFGQRLTINFTQIHSTIVNNTNLDLMENERPKIFPPNFESGCLLNIAECNKLIAGSSIKILEVNNSNPVVTPTKSAFSSNNTDSTANDSSIHTPEIPQLNNIRTVTKDKTVMPVKDIPMRRLSILSATSLLQPIPSIDELAKDTVAPGGIPTPSATLALVSNVGNATNKAVTEVLTSSVPTFTESRLISNPVVTITKEPSSNIFVAPKSVVITTQEKSPSPNIEKSVPALSTQKSTVADKEISEERIEEVAKKLSVDAISSKNAKFQCFLHKCNVTKATYYALNLHMLEHVGKHKPFTCYFCNKENVNAQALVSHLSIVHTYRFFCYYCSFKSPLYRITVNHLNDTHGVQAVISKPITKSPGNGSHEVFVIAPRNISDEYFIQYKYELIEKYNREIRINQHCYDPADVSNLPREAIFLNEIFCSVCKYGTKVRKNMERHLMFHLNEVPVPKIDPINPVPCLSTTERHFDKMKNLACSSQEDRDKVKLIENAPKYVPETQRFTCGAYNCQYVSIDENMLNCHLKTLHYTEAAFKCVHCKPIQNFDCPDNYVDHLRLHDSRLFKCNMCDYLNSQRQHMEKHFSETHNSHLTSIVVIREEATASTSGSASVTLNNSENSNSCVNNNSYGLTWLCNTCTFVTTTKKQIIDHNTQVHNVKSQFLCRACQYRSNNRRNIECHLARKHPDLGENQIFATYSRSDETELNVVDNSPLWRRDANRVKNIRGILFEDEEMAATSDSNTETILSDDENGNDELAVVEPAGTFCCNYCNYMASYRGIKMHHNEKHRGHQFIMKRANLTMTVTSSSVDKPDANDEKIKNSMTMYLCAFCPLRHRSLKKILEHWKNKHQHPKVKSNNAQTRGHPFQFRITRLVRCYYCHEKFGFHELSKHVPRRHLDLPIVTQHFMAARRCGECDFKCESNEADLVEHYKIKHTNSKSRTIPSDLLAESFLNRYIKMDVEQFYICTGCNLESDSVIELQQHLEQNHKDDLSAKIQLKVNKLMYACNYCKHSSDEISVIKHIMKHHSTTNEKSTSTKLLYSPKRFKENIDKFDQMKIMFPNGLVLNKADVVKTRYGGYNHIIKHFSDLSHMPSPLSKKRPVPSDHDNVPRPQLSDIKRLKFTEDDASSSSSTTIKQIKSYDLNKIYTTMQIGDKTVRVTCDKFAALFDINPVVEVYRV